MQLPAAHRSLAARVIGQAVRDVRDPNGDADRQCQRTIVSIGVADAVLLVRDCGARSDLRD